MKQIFNGFRVLGMALVVGLAISMSSVKAAETNVVKITETDPVAQKFLTRLITALETKDLNLFVEDGDANFKAAVKKDVIAEGHAAFGMRLKKGYEATYLGKLKQQGCQVHLWKLVFKDGGDDLLAKLTLLDGKIAGFLLQ